MLDKNEILRKKLGEVVSEAFESCGYDGQLGSVSISNRPDLCQFQCNGAMAGAKTYKRAPLAIAGEVVEKLSSNGLFSMVTVVPPGFINMNITDETIAQVMDDMAADDRMLLPVMDKKTIVIDYGGPNIAKPLHVGHLRTAIIGDSLVRLSRFLGHNIIGDTHLGDWGLQMGLVIAEIKLEQPELIYFDENYTGEYPDEAPVKVEDLNVIYPRASKRSKTDEVFAADAAQITVELQNLHRGYYALWKRLRDISVADHVKNYDILGVHFDNWYGESDADKYIPEVMKAFEDRNLIEESDGALIVRVELPDDKEPMPPMIIQKSNGGDIYGTTDLGTLVQRKQDWNPDEVWYVVDNRQAFHFKQVFRAATLAGILGDTKCIHINFGTMNGKDGKPYKTRDGGVMSLSDLIDDVVGSAGNKVRESAVITGEAEQKEAANTIGMAALRVGDMLNHRIKDFVFDMERFLASEGKTGPYLQYTAVRIASILQKAKDANMAVGPIIVPASDTERGLMLALTTVSEALLRAFEDKTPSVICEVLFDIAGIFNRFYFENKILVCEDAAQRASWLGLCELTQRMLITLLDLLGISVPEKM